MKRLFLPLVILFITSLAFASIDEYYTFNATTGTYTPITGTNAGISYYDHISSAITIGFTFPYGDYLCDNVQISSSGWIGLGTYQMSSNLNNQLASTAIVPVVAPLWDACDLDAGTCQYLLSGTAPNRIFTIQYSNLRWNHFSGSYFNLQVRLYESGKIDFVYGSSTGDPSYPSASIGINMPPGGSGWFYSVTPGTPATASTTTENSTITVWPGQGTIYEFNPLVNNLAALSVTGNTTPIAGQSSNYIVTVRNRGTNPQNTYQVKLLLGTQEVASVNGTAIQPGEILTYTIPWTPTTAGPGVLYGKVVLAGDENPNSDQTPPLNITVQPEGLQSVTIGAGDQLASIPLDFYYINSLYECLYYPDELGFTSGTIISIAFYNNFDVAPSNGATRIWLGSTNQADLSSGWIPSSHMTLVFDGNIVYPSGVNTIHIPLQTPYMHISGNLVMMVQRPPDNQYYSHWDYFYSQTVGSNRARNAYSNSGWYVPANPPANATMSGQFPKTTFLIWKPAIINLFEPVQILMNSSENYLNLLNYFCDPFHFSIYSIPDNQHINYTINENGIMNLIPEQNWFGIEYLTIRSSDQSGSYVEQTLKVTVIQTWNTQEYFNNEGMTPSGWTQQHIGTTSFPWQAVQLEGTNYAMKTTVTTGGTANERLLSPLYNLSNYKDIQVSFDSDFLPYGSGTGSFAYTLNNLTYTVVETYTTSHSGMRTYTISAIDAKPTVRFRWLYSNSTANTGQNNYWIIDNFKIFGIVKDTQAPEAVTALSLVSQDNHSALLSWNPSSDLYFDRYEIYISSDENVTTTDRLWSVNEDHNLYFVSTTQTRINPLTEGEYWIAIRAVDRDNNATPLSESVYVRIDATGPTFFNPIPSGQPEPEWSNSIIVTIGCQINDLNNINLNSIKYRIDSNGNGIYDENEIWQTLPPAKIMNGTKATISVNVSVEYPSEGVLAFEFQATDIYDNTGYSGTNGIEGIEDDWVVRLDYPPAPINNFFVQEVYCYAFLLSWTASSDLYFAGYRIYYSTSPDVSEIDMVWDSSNDPQLAFAGEGIISTTITGLLPATRYYFILQAYDLIGNITQYPQVITAMTSYSIPVTPQNLVITVSGYDIMLNWDAVTLDTSQNPITISYYEVYVSDQPYFECNIDNLLCTTETPCLLIEGGAEFADRLFFQIKAVSGAITKKNKVLPQKK